VVSVYRGCPKKRCISITEMVHVSTFAMVSIDRCSLYTGIPCIQVLLVCAYSSQSDIVG
jgi:hypothetical protein